MLFFGFATLTNMGTWVLVTFCC